MMARRRPCDCGAPLDDAPVITRRFRKLRSGANIGARAETWTFRCEHCGAKQSRLMNVAEGPLHTRRAA